MSHDFTGVLLKIQNSEGVVHVYEVDELGQATVPVTVEPVSFYRWSSFAVSPTYVCECQMEFSVWVDVEFHLEYVSDELPEA